MRRTTRNGVIAVVAASGAMAVAMPASAAFAADGGAAAGGVAAGSPGLASGNAVQLPVHVPVNVCGNTVNVVGLLNPAMGNTCANGGAAGDRSAGGSHRAGRGESHRTGGSGNHRAEGAGSHRAGGAGASRSEAGGGNGRSERPGDGNGRSGQSGSGWSGALGSALAEGGTADSPGVLAGNGLELPVQLPVNLSGNSVSVVGVGNPAFGNESTNTAGDRPDHPVAPGGPTTTPIAPHRTVPAPRPAPHAPAPYTASLAHTGADQAVPAAVGGAALLLTGAVLYRRFRPGSVS
ncbi:chaplin [Streptomyces sp. NPDC005574]|uniref:chaplin n=1 Tax=Streptomyces sp. NPDC005574 TaxID=3156891 RepID=UPI0033BF4E24